MLEHFHSEFFFFLARVLRRMLFVSFKLKKKAGRVKHFVLRIVLCMSFVYINTYLVCSKRVCISSIEHSVLLCVTVKY